MGKQTTEVWYRWHAKRGPVDTDEAPQKPRLLGLVLVGHSGDTAEPYDVFVDEATGEYWGKRTPSQKPDRCPCCGAVRRAT